MLISGAGALPTVNFALLCNRTENHPVNGFHDDDVMNEILFFKTISFIKSNLVKFPRRQSEFYRQYSVLDL